MTVVKTSSALKEWRPLPDAKGSYIKFLRVDKETGQQALLLKMEAGARYPPHVHPGGEDVYVLEGSVQLGADRLGAGDYLYTPPGGIHAAWSQDGCTMLIVVGKPIEPVKTQPPTGADESATPHATSAAPTDVDVRTKGATRAEAPVHTPHAHPEDHTSEGATSDAP
jgi:quercetin dioxygenase-like cupin family protein